MHLQMQGWQGRGCGAVAGRGGSQAPLGVMLAEGQAGRVPHRETSLRESISQEEAAFDPFSPRWCGVAPAEPGAAALM